jgi:hypothetical protein
MEREVAAAMMKEPYEQSRAEANDSVDAALPMRVAALEASLNKLRVWMLFTFGALAVAGIFAAQFLWKNTSHSFDTLSESFQKQIEQRLSANRANLQSQLDAVRRQLPVQPLEQASVENK